eukprot:g1336.t1
MKQLAPGDGTALPPVSANVWVVGAHWALDEAVDVDLSCLMFDHKGRLLEAVNCIASGSSNAAVTHSGDAVLDNPDPDGDDEQMIVRPGQLPPKVHAMVFLASVFKGHLGCVERLRFRVIEEQVGAPRIAASGMVVDPQETMFECWLDTDPVDDGPKTRKKFAPAPALSDSSAVVLCTLYRRERRSNVWLAKLPCITGSGATTKTAMPLAQRCLRGDICPKMTLREPAKLDLDPSEPQGLGAFLSPALITKIQPYFEAAAAKAVTDAAVAAPGQPGRGPGAGVGAEGAAGAGGDDGGEEALESWSIGREAFVEALSVALGAAHPRLLDRHNGRRFITVLHALFDALDVDLPFGSVRWDQFTSFCVGQQHHFAHVSVASAVAGKDAGSARKGGETTCEQMYVEDAHIANPVTRGARVERLCWAQRIGKFFLIENDSPFVKLVDKAGHTLGQLDVRMRRRHLDENAREANSGSQVVGGDVGGEGGGGGGAEYLSTEEMQADTERHVVMLDAAHCPAHRELEDCLALSTNDHRITLWHETNGKFQLKYNKRNEYRCFKEMQATVTQVKLCWNQAASALFAAGVDHHITVWDICAGLPRQRIKAHRALIFDMVALPRLGLLASASFDRMIHLWDFSAGYVRLKSTLKGHHKGIRQLAYSSNILLSAGFEYDAIAWDLSSKTILQRLTGHHCSIVGAALLTTSTREPLRAVTVDVKGNMRLWSIDRDDGGNGFAPCLQAWGCFGVGNIVALAVARLGEDEQEAQRNRSGGSEASFPPILCSGHHIVGYSARKKKQQQRAASAVCFGRATNSIITMVETRLLTISAASGKVQGSFSDAFTSEPSAICVDLPRQRRIIAGTQGGELIVCGLLDGIPLKSCTPFTARVVGLVPCSGTGTLVAAWANASLAVLEEGERDIAPLRQVKGAHAKDITCVCSSYPLSLVATGSSDGSVYVWEYQMLTQCDVCVGHTTDVVSIVFLDSAALPLLASADSHGAIFLWGMRTASRPSGVDGQSSPLLRLDLAASPGDVLVPPVCEGDDDGDDDEGEQLTAFLFGCAEGAYDAQAVTVAQAAEQEVQAAASREGAEGAGEGGDASDAGGAKASTAKLDARAAAEAAAQAASAVFFCAASESGRMRVWDLATVLAAASPKVEFFPRSAWPAEQEGFHARLRYTHVNHKHVACSAELIRRARVLPTLGCQRVWQAHTEAIVSVCCIELQDGRTGIASASLDFSVRVWSSRGELLGVTWTAEAITPTPDDMRILSQYEEWEVPADSRPMGGGWEGAQQKTDADRAIAHARQEAAKEAELEQLVAKWSDNQTHSFLEHKASTWETQQLQRHLGRDNNTNTVHDALVRDEMSRLSGPDAPSDPLMLKSLQKHLRVAQEVGKARTTELTHANLLAMDSSLDSGAPDLPTSLPARPSTSQHNARASSRDAHILALVRQTRQREIKRSGINSATAADKFVTAGGGRARASARSRAVSGAQPRKASVRDTLQRRVSGGSQARRDSRVAQELVGKEHKVQWRNMWREQRNRAVGTNRLARMMAPVDSAPSKFLYDKLGGFQLLPAADRRQILGEQCRKLRRFGTTASMLGGGDSLSASTAEGGSLAPGAGALSSLASTAQALAPVVSIDLSSASGLAFSQSRLEMSLTAAVAAGDGGGSEGVPPSWGGSQSWASEGDLDDGDSVFLTEARAARSATARAHGEGGESGYGYHDGGDGDGDGSAYSHRLVAPRPRTSTPADAMASWAAHVPRTPLSLAHARALARLSQRDADVSPPMGAGSLHTDSPSISRSSSLAPLVPAATAAEPAAAAAAVAVGLGSGSIAPEDRLPLLQSMQRTVAAYEASVAAAAVPARAAASAGGGRASVQAQARPVSSKGYVRYLLDREQGGADLPLSSYVADGGAGGRKGSAHARAMTGAEQAASALKKKQKNEAVEHDGAVGRAAGGELDLRRVATPAEEKQQRVADRRLSMGFAAAPAAVQADETVEEGAAMPKPIWGVGSGQEAASKMREAESKTSSKMMGRRAEKAFAAYADPQHVQHLADMFAQVDEDASGYIDKREMLRIVDRNPNVHVSANMFYKLDHDMDGEVTMSEFFHFVMPQCPRHAIKSMVAWIEKKKQAAQERSKLQHIAFADADSNHDNLLSFEEFMVMLGGPGAAAEAVGADPSDVNV